MSWMHCFWNNVTENRSDILACGYEWPQSFSWQCVSVSGEAQTRRTHTERTQLCDTSSQQKEAMQMSNQLWAMRQNALCSRCHSFTFTFMHLADAIIQSDLQCIQAIHLYCQYVFSGNRTHNLCAANAMLHHWATGTRVLSYSPEY